MDPMPKILQVDRDVNRWSGWSTLTKPQWDNLEKAEAVQLPVAMIECDVLRAYCIYLLAHSHRKFWTSPSSMTGKYHPEDQNRDSEVVPGVVVGGLISHTWHVLATCFEAMRRYGYSERASREDRVRWAKVRDELAFASIIHDWAKCGDPTKGEWFDNTTSDHGEVAAEIVRGPMLDRFLVAFPEVVEEPLELLREMVSDAAHAIEHHYGVWSRARHRPSSSDMTDLDRMLQEADYYSTRRYIKGFDGKRVLDVMRKCSPSELAGCNVPVKPLVVESDLDPFVDAAPTAAMESDSDFMW
jgi:hypothetical protein